MTLGCVLATMLEAAAQPTPVKHEEDAGGPQAQQQASFPAGLRVLVVDDDPVCLKVIEQMLRACQYSVCTCSAAATALEQLRDKSHNFDLVLSDVYMPDMDGFKLLEVVGLELGLPVIMMSANDEHSTVMRGVTHGACDFLIKPVRIEELKNIWQHVVRRSRHNTALVRDAESDDAPGDQDADSRKRNVHSRDGSCNEQQQQQQQQREDEGAASKKPRLVWTVEMHQQFVQAVNVLGVEKAVPKKILELMKVEGLTRENVASHLQKYRLYLKRVQTEVPQPGGFPGAANAAAAAAAAAGAGSGVYGGGMGMPGMMGAGQMMWGNSKQLMGTMQAQQQAGQQAAAGQLSQQHQQHPQMLGQHPQMQMGGDAGGMMSGMLNMGPGGSALSPMGQMMPGMSMNTGGMAGMPGMGPMPGMGAAAAAGGMMSMPGMPGVAGYGPMMGMLPGMPGVPGAMQGMCGPMGAMGQMPGMQPGMPGGPSDPTAVMAMMSANMQAMFQAQHQAVAAAAAAAAMPTGSGGGSSTGPMISPQQQVPPQALPQPQQSQKPQMSTAGQPTPAAAGPASATAAAPPASMAAVPAGGMQTSAAAAAAAAPNLAAGPGMVHAAAQAPAQPAAAAPSAGATDFSNVFDDVFDRQPHHTQQAGAAPPAGTAAAAPLAGSGAATAGAVDEFLDYFLKGN